MNNVSGQRIALWVHAALSNAELEHWRREHNSPFATWDRVAGGQIGNLTTPTGWLDWDLANASSRDRVLAEVRQAIDELVLPYFHRFEDLSTLHCTLLAQDLPGLDLKDAVELFLCFLSVESAETYLAAWLARHRKLLPGIRSSLADLEEGYDLKKGSAAYAVQVAYLLARFGLRRDLLATGDGGVV